MKKRSIGFRLSGWYFLVFACGLGLFSVVAWFAMRASVYHAIDDELRDRVRGVTKFMEQQISSLSVAEIRDEFREHSVLGPGGDLFQSFLASRKEDDVNAARRPLARELLADTRRRSGDERPRAIRVLVELLHVCILRMSAY